MLLVESSDAYLSGVQLADTGLDVPKIQPVVKICFIREGPRLCAPQVTSALYHLEPLGFFDSSYFYHPKPIRLADDLVLLRHIVIRYPRESHHYPPTVQEVVSRIPKELEVVAYEVLGYEPIFIIQDVGDGSTGTYYGRARIALYKRKPTV